MNLSFRKMLTRIESVPLFNQLAQNLTDLDSDIALQGLQIESQFYIKVSSASIDDDFPVKFLPTVYTIIQKLEEGRLKVSIFSYNGEEMEYSSFPTDDNTIEKIIPNHILQRLKSYKICQGLNGIDKTMIDNTLIEKYGQIIYYRSKECTRLLIGTKTCFKCQELKSQIELIKLKHENMNTECKNEVQLSQEKMEDTENFLLQTIKVEDESNENDLDPDFYHDNYADLKEEPLDSNEVFDQQGSISYKRLFEESKPIVKEKKKKEPKSVVNELDKRKCTYCGKVFSSPGNLNTHIKEKHLDLSVTCDLCGKVLKSNRLLAKHKKYSHRDNNDDLVSRICKYCNKVFSADTNLYKHIQNVHEVKMVPCHICGKLCKSKYYLTEHVRNAHGEKNQNGTHEKRFKCEFADCDSAFTTKANLMHHISGVHTKEFRYTCSICGKKFNFRSALSMHENTHRGKFKFECDLCDKKFQSRNTFEGHRRSHTGEKPFACPICNIKMSRPDKIKEHIKVVHKITWQEAELQTNTKIAEKGQY